LKIINSGESHLVTGPPTYFFCIYLLSNDIIHLFLTNGKEPNSIFSYSHDLLLLPIDSPTT